jgi:hypothetical protein
MLRMGELNKQCSKDYEKLPKTTEQFLDLYKDRYGHFFVKDSIKSRQKWILYGTYEYKNSYVFSLPKHRIIFSDEVVIDIDHPNIQYNKDVAIELMESWYKNGLKFLWWDSGSKKSHFHFIFPELNMYDTVDRPLMKMLIMRWLCRDYTMIP